MIARIFPVAIIGVVIITYFVYNFFFSVNFPFQDDFLLIQFIEVVSQGKLGFAGLVTELFRTFNDHKAVVPRLIALVEYTLTGHLNFRFYILLVQLNIIYIFGFVYLQFRKMRLPLYLFLPAPFLFFHPLFHDVSGWALNGMQHTFLTAFTITAIILVSSRVKGGIYWAMLCCFLATFTHGNGILSFPAIIFYYLCLKDFRKALVTGFFMFVCLAVYLIGYESGQAMNLPRSAATFLWSFFAFIGSEMSIFAFPEALSAIWGLVITAFMCFLMVKVAAIYFNKPTGITPGTVELLTLFAFIAVTSFVIALFRSWTGSTIASRFQIYAALSTVMFYILLVCYTTVFRRRNVLAAVTGLSVIYWAYSYYSFTGVVAIKKTTYLADIYNWSANRNMFSVEKTIIRNADFYLTPGYQKGFFKLPPALATPQSLDSMFTAHPAAAADYQMFVETWTVERPVRDGNETLNQFFITSHEAPMPMHLLANRFLVLRSERDQRIHLMCADPKIEGRKKVLLGGPYYKKGFNTLVRRDDLEAGNYEMGLLDVENSGAQTFYKLDRTLRVGDGKLSLN